MDAPPSFQRLFVFFPNFQTLSEPKRFWPKGEKTMCPCSGSGAAYAGGYDPTWTYWVPYGSWGRQPFGGCAWGVCGGYNSCGPYLGYNGSF